MVRKSRGEENDHQTSPFLCLGVQARRGGSLPFALWLADRVTNGVAPPQMGDHVRALKDWGAGAATTTHGSPSGYTFLLG